MHIHHDPLGRRFVTEVDGFTAVLIYHVLEDGLVDLASTYVPDQLRGRQVGTALVMAALAWARGRGGPVRASCWFVRLVASRRPEFQDLLVA